MEINRNQYLMFGVIVLLLGIQLRVVDHYVLNERATRFLAERAGTAGSTSVSLLQFSQAPLGRKTIRPPRWCGWCITSIGAILVLHSLALRKPGGG